MGYRKLALNNLRLLMIFTLTLNSFLCVSTILFIVGIFGIILNRKNILLILLSIELILLSVNLNFIFFSSFLGDFYGQLFAFFVLSVAAAESAIGLAILVIFYKVHNTLSMKAINLLQGLVFFRCIAQWLERLVDNQKVNSSSLFTPIF